MMTYTDRKGNPLTTEQLKACYDRAQAKSRTNDPRLEKTSQSHTGRYPTYSVIGQTGIYTVTVDAAGYHCNCVAGSNGKVCWHSASTYRARLVEKMNRVAPVTAIISQPVKATPARPTLESMYDSHCEDCHHSNGRHRYGCAAIAEWEPDGVDMAKDQIHGRGRW